MLRVFSLLVVLVCTGQVVTKGIKRDTTDQISAADIAIILNRHNEHRRAVDPTAQDMQKMVWDPEIAVKAQAHANSCQNVHDTYAARAVDSLPNVPVGQNIAWGQANWLTAIDGWHGEVEYFTYGVNASLSGHFTQVVYAKAARLGCGFRNCSGSAKYICNYAAGQGNMLLPYANGTTCELCPNSCNDNLCDCGGKVCANYGTLNLDTCQCTCQPIYVGDTCTTLSCPNEDPYYCWTQWTPDMCPNFYNVPLGCPYMCGICNKDGTA